MAEPNRELIASSGFVCRSLDRIVACLDGLSEAELNWHPSAAGANGLYAIAVHTLANAEENLLRTLCGQPPADRREYPHEREWSARGETADEVRERWADLRKRIEMAMTTLVPSELDRERPHARRGLLTGREVLMVAARHAAEHQGQADLTRDLVLAKRSQAAPP